MTPKHNLKIFSRFIEISFCKNTVTRINTFIKNIYYTANVAIGIFLVFLNVEFNGEHI